MKHIFTLFLLIKTISCNQRICPVKKGYIESEQTQHPFSIYEPNNKIKITSNSPEVISVSKGEVIDVIDIDSSEITMIIRFKNNYFIYSGLENLNFKKGDSIKKKDVLGKLKSNNGKFELGFQYRENSAKLNPINCIKCKFD